MAALAKRPRSVSPVGVRTPDPPLSELVALARAVVTPGPCATNTARVPWTRVTRPLRPLDDP